jgi:hypothetical protein
VDARLGDPRSLSVLARRGGVADGGRPAVAGEGMAAQGGGIAGRRVRGGLRRVAVAGRQGPRRELSRGEVGRSVGSDFSWGFNR